MDFALNEEQLELQEMVRDFVEKEIIFCKNWVSNDFLIDL